MQGSVGEGPCACRVGLSVEISECGVPCLCVGSVHEGSCVHVGSLMRVNSGVCLCDGHVWDLVCCRDTYVLGVPCGGPPVCQWGPIDMG